MANPFTRRPTLHFKDVFKMIMQEEAYKCALWCFGEGFEDKNSSDLPKMWNSIHSDLFHINGQNNIMDDIERMCSEYINLKGNNGEDN